MMRRCCILICVLMLGLAEAALAGVAISEPFEGVRYIEFTRNDPRQIRGFLLDIDLSAEGIGFAVTPSNGDLPSETTRQTTRQFVTEQGAQAAINGDFYSVNGAYAGLSGMNASEGDIYSPWGAGSTRPSLNISQDNIATMVRQHTGYNDGVSPLPDVDIYNAIGGNAVIVQDGFNRSSDTSLAPRTVSGITADNRLLLMVVDGRRTGYSAGVSTKEAADLLIEFGAVSGINHDGGGSTTMVLANGSPTVVNRPSDNVERLVGNNLALFANPGTSNLNYAIFNDFARGDADTFSFAPGYSGSTQGINASQSTNEVVQADGVPGIDGQDNGYVQRLTIVADDPDTTTTENPDGWFVRHVSGSSASQLQNISRPTSGFVGFWARTTEEGGQIALAIDDANNTTADRGHFKPLIADGQWHLYEWDLEDDSQWHGWINGDGVIDTSTFTLDSIQIMGRGDMTVELDMITHNANGSVIHLVPEPSAALMLGAGGLMLLPRRSAVDR